MSDSAARKSAERLAFEHFLRTGRRMDPSPRPLPKRLAQRRSDGRPVPYLSPQHNEIRAQAVRYPPDPGTKEWSVVDLADWKLANGDIFSFKRQWVRGYRNAIKAAARRFDLPAGLVAGVAFTEVGGDPSEIDGLAYTVRGMIGDRARDRTSFGDLSVQFRRATHSLGYSTERELTSAQRAMVIASLQDPQTGIFIAAKHLSELRDVDFRGVPGSRLGKKQVEVIASRYNRGPDLPREQIEKNLSYGRSITKRWTSLYSLLQ